MALRKRDRVDLPIPGMPIGTKISLLVPSCVKFLKRYSKSYVSSLLCFLLNGLESILFSEKSDFCYFCSLILTSLILNSEAVDPVID